MEENTLKTKQEILTALAHSGDDKLLLAGLLDKEQTCEQRGYLTHTKFLDLKQRALCTDAVRLAGATGHALFWGGYEDAERGIYLFYPDYMDAESAKLSAPLALLRARKRREDTLTHRDYLGSLMGLQIDRSVVGDILVHEEGADIIVLEDMAEFILHALPAGRAAADRGEDSRRRGSRGKSDRCWRRRRVRQDTGGDAVTRTSGPAFNTPPGERSRKAIVRGGVGCARGVRRHLATTFSNKV